MDIKLKKSILIEVYKYLKKRDYGNFMASIEKMKSPKKIVEKQTGNIFQPDMTATHNGFFNIFEIEMGENIKPNNENFIKKCKVFERYAASKEGKLYLIVPIQKFDMIITEINKNNLENVGILQLENV